jgi:Flp pilus assembly pilin Flp
MKMAMKCMKSILASEKGQGMVEYVLAITSISLIALINMQWIGTWLASAIGNITAAM